jgi:cobyrinic acid a,c-diamide synthase
VVLNRVGSPRHARLATAAIEAIGIPVVGALPRSDSIALPERHLGLVQAGETTDLDTRLDRIATFVADHVWIDAIQAMAARGHGADPGRAARAAGSARARAASGTTPGTASSATPGTPGGATPGTAGGAAVRPPGQRIAVARDAAFSFLYPHILQGWRTAGAEIRFFSPLAGQPPDDDADACWLPGGYPELHAGQLAASYRFLNGLRRFAETRPVHGECGGYMALGTSLTDAAGVAHAMAGLLNVSTSFAQRKLHLGYRNAQVTNDGCLGPAGTRLRGHEFHYASVATQGSDAPFAMVSDAYGSDPLPAGSRRGLVSGSFFHVIAAEP